MNWKLANINETIFPKSIVFDPRLVSSEADQKPLTLEDEMKQQTATFQSKVLSLGTDSLHPLFAA